MKILLDVIYGWSLRGEAEPADRGRGGETPQPQGWRTLWSLGFISIFMMSYLRGHVHMTSALTGGRGFANF